MKNNAIKNKEVKKLLKIFDDQHQERESLLRRQGTAEKKYYEALKTSSDDEAMEKIVGKYAKFGGTNDLVPIRDFKYIDESDIRLDYAVDDDDKEERDEALDELNGIKRENDRHLYQLREIVEYMEHYIDEVDEHEEADLELTPKEQERLSRHKAFKKKA